MSGKTAGQQARNAYDAMRGSRATEAERWEAAGAAVETEQVRLAREDRDQLRKRVLDLAAELEDEAARNDCACEAKTGNDAAVRLRKVAGPPS